MNDKVSNIMAVLIVIKREFERTSNDCDFTELRKEAVKEVAETELNAKKYKNQRSSQNTIHDACTKRLKPDIDNVVDFDRVTEQWLRHNSMQLKDILLKHCKSRSQRDEVISFFRICHYE